LQGRTWKCKFKPKDILETQIIFHSQNNGEAQILDNKQIIVTFLTLSKIK
jgi:hypothetical protein